MQRNNVNFYVASILSSPKSCLSRILFWDVLSVSEKLKQFSKINYIWGSPHYAYWILLVYAIQLWIVIDISTLNQVVRLVDKENNVRSFWSCVERSICMILNGASRPTKPGKELSLQLAVALSMDWVGLNLPRIDAAYAANKVGGWWRFSSSGGDLGFGGIPIMIKNAGYSNSWMVYFMENPNLQ